MSSLLDIDLDYFCLVNEPVQRFRGLLAWAGCPVALVVERHNKVLPFWRSLVRRRRIFAGMDGQEKAVAGILRETRLHFPQGRQMGESLEVTTNSGVYV